MLGKATRLRFPKQSNTKFTIPLEMVSLDLWGPVRDASIGARNKYVLSIIDHATRMVWSYPLPNKESATVQERLEAWRVRVERQTDRKLRAVRSDNGREFKGAVDRWMQ